MRHLKLFLAALLLASVPVSAQLTDTYVIAGAAKANGNNGTRWLTQFSVFNPHLDYPLTISVTLIRTRGAAGNERLIELPPNATYVTDDVMGDVFNTTGSGSLLVAAFPEDNPGVGTDVIDLAFLVNSNTYNDSPSGTYGQTVPGVWSGLLNYATDDISAVAHGIDNSARLGFRTNIGALNLGRCNINLLISAYNADGVKVLDEAPFGVPPLAHFQDSLPVQLEGGSVEFFVVDQCASDEDKFAVVFPYTSTIDDLSGDPRYQTPSMLATPGVIFGKKAGTQKVVDPTQLGRKLDKAYARGVRATATRLGTAKLVRGERGWQIAK